MTDNEDPNNLGRVRVQFDWQAQLDDNMMTLWLRIAQPYPNFDTVCQSWGKVGDNKDEQIEHKLQVTAENIRTEAQDQLLEYSKTHHIKAEDQTAIYAGTRIDIKAGIVKAQ